jgi:hypothetical protein
MELMLPDRSTTAQTQLTQVGNMLGNGLEAGQEDNN